MLTYSTLYYTLPLEVKFTMEQKFKKSAKFFSENRKRTGLNLTDWANLLGISISQACNIEKGRRGLNFDLRETIEKKVSKMRLR